MTKNQKKAFPEVEKTGATVVGKGKPGFPGGTTIPPTRVEIIRPDPTL
ncbi:hemagglutinin/hemolysin-related protein [Pseudomonas chlororaphis subsp. aurantiaca]|nr:hemagglutinin/hemolysin-related protein [Pseudomonas chlororaphis subsp. aurantiaca]